MMNRYGIILDRDGTLIDMVRDEETGVFTTAFHPSQVHLLPGVEAGLKKAVQAGFVLAIATNQPGPAKGYCTSVAVERTNAYLVNLLATLGIPIAQVEVCMHHPQRGDGGDVSLQSPCSCRKPAPGMLFKIVHQLGWDPSESWMLGDTEVDVRAGQAAGLRTGLVFTPDRCELCPLRGGMGALLSPDRTSPRLDLLMEAVLGFQSLSWLGQRGS